MTFDEWIRELEDDPTGTDLIDLGELLEACDYVPRRYERQWTVVYHQAQWGSRLTFTVTGDTIPVKRLREILAFLRDRLFLDGRLYDEVSR